MKKPERRRHARLALARPVKLQCVQTGRFLAGQTQNVSSGGALVEVNHPSLLVPGQRVSVGVAWTRRDVLLQADHLLAATVVRSLGHGRDQRVAIQFDREQELAATG